MNIDIRLSLEFFDHPKTKKLRKRLGIDGVLALLKLWAWTAGNRPNGVLTGLDVEAVELAADWGGEEGAFVPVLLELRLLDEVDGVFAVHDWEDHQAYASKSEERSSKARKAAEARWNRTTEQPANTERNAQSMLDDAASNAQHMLGDATSMLGHAVSNAPETRNQDPKAKINTPLIQEYFNINTRARALNPSGGRGKALPLTALPGMRTAAGTARPAPTRRARAIRSGRVFSPAGRSTRSSRAKRRPGGSGCACMRTGPSRLLTPYGRPYCA